MTSIDLPILWAYTRAMLDVMWPFVVISAQRDALVDQRDHQRALELGLGDHIHHDRRRPDSGWRRMQQAPRKSGITGEGCKTKHHTMN